MRRNWLIFFALNLAGFTLSYGQSAKSLIKSPKSLFKSYRSTEIPGNKFDEILVDKHGLVLVSASEFSFMMITGGNVGIFTFGLENQNYGIRNLESVFTGAPIKTITESRQGYIFFSTAENQITYFQVTDENNDDESGQCDIPPFYFPMKGDTPKEITELWFDSEDNLFIGVTDGAFYMVPKAGSKSSLDIKNYTIGVKDSSMFILKGELPVKKIGIPGTGVYSFAENSKNKDVIFIGTSQGMFNYTKNTGELNKLFYTDSTLTITHIETFPNGDAWFSTLEKGMGVYHHLTKTSEFFPYPKKPEGATALYPIQDFCVKTSIDFFVAVKDSTPAIFNTLNRSYKFINDSSFVLSKNSTTDIRLDTAGNFYFIKGDLLYSAHISDNPEWMGADTANLIFTPLIYGVTDFNNREITNFLTNPELLDKLKLKYNENSIIIYVTSNYYSQNKKTQFAFKLDGDLNNWVEMPVYSSDIDSSNMIELPDIKPGKYILRVKVKVGDGDWSKKEATMQIIVTPPYWATWWFWSAIIVFLFLLFYIIVKLRVRAVRKTERLKARYEKELLELEAKALRAQMNPHFVFNCLNSIKALMQENQNEKGVSYLTTFSKLIRTLFNNADKKEISLYDEIETCKFYLQLEALRFDEKFSYSVNVNENIDLKSMQVPALIVQPFIENAIWHGIVPRGTGGKVSLSVLKDGGDVQIIIDDDGIGREASQQNKSASGLTTHQSKGVNLTQSRLKLDNLLQQRKATIETIDKKDENGKATGTKVSLTIKEEI